jgi:multiple antibiotic resistance protein
MPLDYTISALVTLLVVLDPIGLAPMFFGLTSSLLAPDRRQVALRACLIAGVILIGAALIGDWLLRQLGITLHAFRIAGGLLLFAIAFEMVFGLRSEHDSKTAEQAAKEHIQHIAAFPLAIPLLAGPGAITATILLAGQAGGRPEWIACLLAVIVAALLACMAAFLAATRIGKLLGVTGNIVMSRLLGVVLAALAAQYVIDGVRAAIMPAH